MVARAEPLSHALLRFELAVLSSLQSRQNFTLPRNCECSALDAGNAQSAPLGSSAKQPFGPFAETSTLNAVRQHVMGMRGQQWSVISLVSRPACTHGLCLASDVGVRYRWFPSECDPADEPSRRFEWSSQYHAPFRVTSNSRLPRRCFFLDELDPPSADSHAAQRVETKTGSQPGRQSLCSTAWVRP